MPASVAARLAGVRAVSSFFISSMVYTGNLVNLLVVAQSISTASHTNLQACRRNGRQHLAKTICVK